MAEFWDKIKELETTKLSDFPLEKLEEYHSYFASIQRLTGDAAPQARLVLRAAEAEMVRLEGEIGRRHSKAQHDQAMQLGGQTLGVGKQGLSWAKVGALNTLPLQTASEISSYMKYIITSKITKKNYLVNDETDFEKDLLNVIQSSQNGPLSVRPFSKDVDEEEIWSVYVDKVALR